MFNHLIESGSHRTDLARKGRFFLGTLGLYGLLLAGAGVASVQAYHAHLGTQNYEIVFLPPPVTAEAERPRAEVERARPASGGMTDRVAVRREAFAPLTTVMNNPPPVSSARVTSQPVLPNMPFVIGKEDFTPVGPVGPRTNNSGVPGGGGVMGAGRRAVVVETGEVEPEPVAKPLPTPEKPKQIRLSSHIISGKVVSKPAPPYPPIAKAAGVSGPVIVEIVIDEQGAVISARAVDGPALLRVAAERGARQARFSPTILGGQAVKVSGVITYNFMLR